MVGRRRWACIEKGDVAFHPECYCSSCGARVLGFLFPGDVEFLDFGAGTLGLRRSQLARKFRAKVLRKWVDRKCGKRRSMVVFF